MTRVKSKSVQMKNVKHVRQIKIQKYKIGKMGIDFHGRAKDSIQMEVRNDPFEYQPILMRFLLFVCILP